MRIRIQSGLSTENHMSVQCNFPCAEIFLTAVKTLLVLKTTLYCLYNRIRFEMSSKQAVMYSCTLATKYADLQQKQEHSAHMLTCW